MYIFKNYLYNYQRINYFNCDIFKLSSNRGKISRCNGKLMELFLTKTKRKYFWRKLLKTEILSLFSQDNWIIMVT